MRKARKMISFVLSGPVWSPRPGSNSATLIALQQPLRVDQSYRDPDKLGYSRELHRDPCAHPQNQCPHAPGSVLSLTVELAKE